MKVLNEKIIENITGETMRYAGVTGENGRCFYPFPTLVSQYFSISLTYFTDGKWKARKKYDALIKNGRAARAKVFSRDRCRVYRCMKETEASELWTAGIKEPGNIGSRDLWTLRTYTGGSNEDPWQSSRSAFGSGAFYGLSLAL